MSKVRYSFLEQEMQGWDIVKKHPTVALVWGMTLLTLGGSIFFVKRRSMALLRVLENEHKEYTKRFIERNGKDVV